MKIMTIDGNERDIAQDLIDGFKLKIKGQLLFPQDTLYNDSRTLWNAMIDRKPAMIVKCIGTADILAAVQFARDNSLLMCIKAGGHNIAGLAAAEGGIMIDLSLMRGVWVDKKNKIAHAQGGCLLGDIDRETQLHGLAAVLGFVSQTGAAGLTLGGGFGYLTRRWGWTADNIAGMEIVTSDGKLIRANAKENNDLFWGLRGGGGNFGVVSSIDYNLYEVGPEIIGGLIAWPAEESEKILKFFKQTADSAPEELTMVAIIRPAPPAPWLTKEWHFKPIIALLACWSGNLEEGKKYLEPIKKFGKPIADIIIPRPYVQMNSLLDTANPKGRRYYWKSEYLPELKDEMFKSFITYGGKITSPFSAMILFQLGGALNQLDETYSPAGNRAAQYVLNITSAWEKPEEDEQNISWARDAWNEMKKFSTGGTYLNFLTEDDGKERTRYALGNNLLRLKEIKTKWDKDNFFRMNWNITPL
ncbi:MAG TPA: FAD-binding protein [Ignavibacteriaceae bacterium]|nr:FAD-binding protein [Ignavibacteriaceae bacterium]